MYGRTDRIQRNHRALFSRRRSNARLYFMGFLTALVVLVPLFAFWQFDRLQLLALEQLGRAPTSTPLASERAERGMQLFLAGDVAGALRFFEAASNQRPENVSYLYEYGMLLIESNRNEEAVTIGDRMIELAPDDPRGYAVKARALQWSDAAAAIPVAIAGTELGQPFAPLHSALAVAYTNIGRYGEALGHGELALRIDENNPNAYRSYSYPLIYTGRYNEAIAQLETAIELNPNYTAPYLELASLYRRIDDEEMALGIYFRVVEVEPDNALAYLRICETYAAVGRFDDAAIYCDRALEIDPLFGSAWRMSGQLAYSRRNYEGAIENFETCLDLQEPGEEEIECYYIRGLAHYFLDQCDDAWRVLNEALELATAPQIQNAIRTGLNNVTVNCAGYRGRALPTTAPPTPIPPTPIGGT